jgi:translin
MRLSQSRTPLEVFAILTGLDQIADRIRERFEKLDEGREQAYVISRQVVRAASTCIKSVHRQEFDEADALLRETAELNTQMIVALQDCDELRWGGFVGDAEKEYAEAAITLAVIRGRELPPPESLGVDLACWLNGLAEAAGEFRRHVLDLIRMGDLARAEAFLNSMDDIYHLIMGFDYPNAISLGLRGRSDAVRGFVERTRGDLTNALRQQRLEERLTSLENRLAEDAR